MSELSIGEASLLDAIPDPYFTIDREQRFRYINATARRLWGYESHELIGTALWDAFPDAVGVFGYAQIQAALEDGIPRQFEVDSAYLGYWTEVRLHSFRSGLAITYRDISQRKLTEAALLNRAQQQEIIVQLGEEALSGEKFEQLVDRAVLRISNTLNVDYVNVFQLDSENLALRLIAGSGWHAGNVGEFVANTGTASLAGFALQTGESVIVDDLTQETRFDEPELLTTHGVRSSMSVIIGSREHPFGVLGVHTRERVNFTQDDVLFLQAIANILATAYDRNRAELIMRHHDAIVTSSEDAIISESLDGIITSWNESAARMFGYTVEEAIGQSITIIYPPDQTAGAYNVLDQVKRGLGIEQMETIRQRKNGERFDASISVSPIRDMSGQIIGAAKIERDISDRKRNEAARRASEDRLQLALDAGNMGTWDWEIASGRLSWSPNMIEMHGLKFDDFHGRFEDFSDRIHPEDRDRVLASIQDALASNDLFHLEYRNLRPDGSLQWLETRGRVSLGDSGDVERMNGVCIDVTDQVRLRQQIARFAAATVAERDQLQQVIDVIPEGVVIVTADGQIGVSNEAAREIWGDQLSDIDLREHQRHDMSEDKDRPLRFAELPIWSSITTGAYVLGEQITIERIDSGDRLQLLLNSAPLRDERGYVTAAVTTFQDITALKDFERQKDDFLQLISHDVKNPLTAIKGNAQLLRRRVLANEPALMPFVERIEDSTDRATALIDELVDMTRLQMGRRLDLVQAPVAINDLVHRLVDEFRASSDRHRFRVNLALEPIIGFVDEYRVVRVLSNLLSNAIKYSDGDGEIIISTTLSDDEADWFEISVRDHGIGIPAADLPFLFERFRRGSNVEGQIRGTGLGLAGSKQIVEQHGGSMLVATEEGNGSTFTVRLPLAPVTSLNEQSESV